MQEKLIQAAKAAAANAWSPYSSICFGAAIETVDGEIISGCNVENASYGLTQCAERNALTAAITNGLQGQLKTLLIWSEQESPAAPCGACRQVIAELMPADSVIHSVCASGKHTSWSITELLPHQFEYPCTR